MSVNGEDERGWQHCAFAVMGAVAADFEIVRLIWDRMPEVERQNRFDLLEVAADFHRMDASWWLLSGRRSWNARL